VNHAGPGRVIERRWRPIDVRVGSFCAAAHSAMTLKRLLANRNVVDVSYHPVNLTSRHPTYFCFVKRKPPGKVGNLVGEQGCQKESNRLIKCGYFWAFDSCFVQRLARRKQRDYFEGKQDSLLLIYCGLNPGLFHGRFNAACADLVSYAWDTRERMRNCVLIQQRENRWHQFC